MRSAGTITPGRTSLALFALAVLVSAFLVSARSTFAAGGDDLWTPSPSGGYFRALLFQAQHAESEYYRITAEDGADIDRSSSLESAVEAWTIIWQCYGYGPAVDKIRELSILDPGVERHVGFSPDLTIEADATLLKLRNPRFDHYSVFLIRVVDRHYEPLVTGDDAVSLLDVDGKWWKPERITKEHPLWEGVSKIYTSFLAARTIDPGVTYSFKQVFASPNLTTDRIRLILVDTGQGAVAIPFLETLGSSSGLAGTVEREKAEGG